MFYTGSDSGNGSGDSALSSTTDTGEAHKNCGVIIKNPRYNSMTTSESSTTLKNFEMDWLAAEEKLMQLEQPELNLVSRYRIDLTSK